MNEFNGFPESRRLFSRLVRHARLRQLQLLLALQHSGSVVKAAQHLDMSQSAATQALAELERVLELRLFERHSRGMRATQAGQALIDVARGVMNELQDAAETLAAIRLGANTSLRLGAIPAAAHAILGPLLGRFYALQGQVHVDVQEGEGKQLLPLLMADRLDAVFCRSPAMLPDSHVFTPLLDDEAVFIAGPDHPLANAAQVNLTQMAEARWVLPTASINVRDIFERVVLAHLPHARWFSVSTVSLAVLEGLLAQPQAVTVVPRSILPGLHPSGTSARVCVLDVVMADQEMALPPLGVVHAKVAMPALLRQMLGLWTADVQSE
jgi:DNA-binding transcriptional LysR family regulator